MLNSTTAPLTSKSPLSETDRLTAEVWPRLRLTGSDREQMYRLLESYFENTSRRQFDEDLSEKDTVILLRDRENGQVAGFSTLMNIPITLEGQRVAAFFSGDTIIAREHWGSSLLGRLWLRTVFGEADRIRQRSPETLVYWFLISSGYKTWRYLPIFFVDYTPHPQRNPPPFERRVLDALAAAKFGPEYDSGSGVIRFHRASPLRPGVADVTGSRLRDPLVEFFVRKNPEHARGDELACLAAISRSNLTRAGLRLLDSGGRP
jgi:hypothetical protein